MDKIKVLYIAGPSRSGSTFLSSILGEIQGIFNAGEVIDVWDKGRGIDEIHKERVFERLYTLEDSRNKSFQGSGLGLTITKRLVEKIGGEISLSSKPHEKTTFSIKLKIIEY